MVVVENNAEWLIKLLSHNKTIHIRDGLGTFIQKTDDGWKIYGREDVLSLLEKRLFDNLSFALAVAKSLERRFLKKDKTDARS